MKIYTKEELREQEKVIMDILISGDSEKLQKLKYIMEFGDLHPQIKDLIKTCHRHLQVAIDMKNR